MPHRTLFTAYFTATLFTAFSVSLKSGVSRKYLITRTPICKLHHYASLPQIHPFFSWGNHLDNINRVVHSFQIKYLS